jgi:hypothetical protein
VKKGSTKPVRCAIYTRVSTDQGLEQDFNSLDAQYDAASPSPRDLLVCEASTVSLLPLAETLLRRPIGVSILVFVFLLGWFEP